MKRQPYRLRIRRPDGGWTLSRNVYAVASAHRRMGYLRRAGHVVHLDLTGKGWHRRDGAAPAGGEG